MRETPITEHLYEELTDPCNRPQEDYCNSGYLTPRSLGIQRTEDHEQYEDVNEPREL